MKRKIFYFLFVLLLGQNNLMAQDIQQLLAKAKAKIERVNDYTALGKMKTNVVFLKIPVSKIKMYFKKPGKFSLKSENGVSFVPKGSMSMNLNGVFSDDNYTVIDAGTEMVEKVKVRIAKLLPNDDNSDLVLTTLYIDPVTSLILKSKSTTKENGSYELKMKYSRYADFGLPDEILFSFNTKDYKLPKGITFDFDDGQSKTPAVAKEKPKKGMVQISLSAYQINKGLADAVFK